MSITRCNKILILVASDHSEQPKIVKCKRMYVEKNNLFSACNIILTSKSFDIMLDISKEIKTITLLKHATH